MARRRVRNRTRKKQQFTIDLLALGEGSQKGHAYRVAKAAEEKGEQIRVRVVDIERPNYTPPSTMSFIRMNVLRHLENIGANSVREVRDSYFFNLVGVGKKVNTFAQSAKGIRKLRSAVATGDEATLIKYRRNIDKYVNLVKRVLVPGGRFVITTDSQLGPDIVELLQRKGFDVKSRKLKILEILRFGSPTAKSDLRRGKRAFHITATKPSPQGERK